MFSSLTKFIEIHLSRSCFYAKNEINYDDLYKSFNFDKNYLEIKSIKCNNNFKEILKLSKYAVAKNDFNLINLKQVIDDYKLNNFDSNISFCNRESENLFHYFKILVLSIFQLILKKI